MTRDVLKKALAREVAHWSEKSFVELRQQTKSSVTYVTETEEGAYQTEVSLLESTDEYCHVGVSVDDMTIWRAIKPLSTGFIRYKDGRIDRDEE